MTTTKTKEVKDAAFTARTVPWGSTSTATVINKAIPTAEAIRKAGLDWEVELRPVRFPSRDGKRSLPFKGRDVIVRVDTDTPIEVCSDDYTIVQNREAFDFIDSIHPLIAAAGSLRKGRQVFIVAEAKEFTVVDDDQHQLFVVLRTSHDKSRAVEVFLLPIRGQCMNQLPLRTFGRDAAQRWSVPHVSTAKEKLAEARDVILGSERYIEEFTEMAAKLAAIDLELDETRRILERVLPDRPQRDSVIDTIADMSQNGPFVGHPKTGWGLTNAVGEYFDHIRTGHGITPESRFTNALSGATNKAVNRTAQLLLRRGNG
jgi:phage/plasmid-like protein (TIGR03299 family)